MNKPFVIQALDPFHDTAVRPTGYPGGGTSRTIVQRVKQQISVAAPVDPITGLTFPGNWSAHVMLLPFMPAGTTTRQVATFQVGSNSVISGYSASTSGPIAACVGGCTVISTPDSQLYNPVLQNPNSNVVTVNPTSYLVGPTRVVSAAFEVANTTAEIYRQGSVSCYRCPTVMVDDTFIAASTSVPNYVDAINIDFAPASLSQINRIPGTTTWLAGEGVYVVATPNNKENPLVRITNRPVVWATPDSVSTSTRCSQSGGTAQALSGTTTLLAQNTNGGIVSPMTISGAYFSGLSNQTTLTITSLFIIERAPEPWEVDLVVLSQVAEKYDDVALALIMSAGELIPPGTKLENNASGDWWRHVRGILQKTAVGLVSGVGNMLAPGAGPLLGTAVDKAIERRIARNEAKRAGRPNKPKQPVVTERALVLAPRAKR